LAIVKIVDDANPNVGDTVTFKITVTNNGPNTATNVTVQELMDSGLKFVSATPSQGGFNQSTGIWTVGTVSLAGVATLLVRAIDTNADPVTNTASIAHSDQFDPITANNSASTTVKGAQADLAVIKTVDNPTANVGEAVNFTITVSNLDGSAVRD